MIDVAVVYGPIAAYLVEASPAKIRYTSLSLPYPIGNGISGGLVPLTGLSIRAAPVRSMRACITPRPGRAYLCRRQPCATRDPWD